MAVIKRIGVLSVGKIYALIGAAVGLAIGVLWFLGATFLGAIFGAVVGKPGAGAGLGAGLGLLAMIGLPLVYGLMFFVGGCLSALAYNFAAKYVGGVEIELEK